jgi:hypothetical protein
MRIILGVSRFRFEFTELQERYSMIIEYEISRSNCSLNLQAHGRRQ